MVSVVTVSTNNKKRKVLIAAGIVLLLLAAGGTGVFVRWLQTKDNKGGQTTTSPQTQSGLPEEIDALQQMRAAGFDEAADQKINEALNDPTTTSRTRYLLYIQQGNGLLNKQDAQGAIASYLKAEEVERTYEVTMLLGDTYRIVGNKAKAIEYYQKTIPLVPTSPLQDETIDSLQHDIAELEKQ